MADDLKIFLRSLEPSLKEGKYFICSFSESQLMGLAGYMKHIVAIFKEEEGLTAVFGEAAKDALAIYSEKKMEGPFALVTLSVISPLLSVGLLAKVTDALAKEKIPVNAYSAYFHDHLLVPYEKREAALTALKKLQKSA